MRMTIVASQSVSDELACLRRHLVRSTPLELFKPHGWWRSLGGGAGVVCRSLVSAESAEECNMMDMQLIVGMNEMNERIRVAEARVTEAE